MSILNNRLLKTDSYKLSHFAQYPKGTSYISSYIEARGSTINGCDEIVVFGLQKFIKDFLLQPITRAEVFEAKAFADLHGEPFNLDGWLYIVDKHNGFLPLHIEAIAEGTVVKIGTPIVQITNTDDKCAWLTSYFEPAILQDVWYGSTVATISRECKKAIVEASLKSSNDLSGVPFKLHDFGYRGVSSTESAQLGGAAHLVNFMGSDTIAGICGAMHYYNADMAGFSIPAAEHSTMTIRGKEGEREAFQAMIDAYATEPGKIFAVVSDAYDIYNAVRNLWAGNGLLEQVKAKGCKVVIRPDSGDPLVVPIDIVELLWDLTPEKLINSKGYKILPPYVGVIQGDGINVNSIPKIIDNLLDRGFSMDCLNFGMGGGLLQQVNRDTFKWAMKASWGVVNGKEIDIYKDPVTDQGKKSKRGHFAVTFDKKTGEWTVHRKQQWYALGIDAPRNMLETVYMYSNGQMQISLHHFADVKRRAEIV
jgi:nicotinamide phosphoribosyltransferase